MKKIVPEPDWKEAAAEIAENEAIRTVYVLGTPATGKSSLCLYLYETLLEGGPAAYLDCDCGQSTAAVPLTVALRTGRPPFTPPKLLSSRFLTAKFVGSTSPVKHLLQTTDGIVRLHRKGLDSSAGKIVVDSSGFVTGDLAEEFQYNVIDMVDPDMILALSPEGRRPRGAGGGKDGTPEGLDFILDSFEGSSTIIRRLSISSSARERSRTERSRYREKRLTEYFVDSRDVVMDLEGLGLHGFVPSPEDDGPLSPRGMVTGLLDHERFLLAVGITNSWNPEKKRLKLRVPNESLSALDRTSSLQFGLMRLNLDGTETEDH